MIFEVNSVPKVRPYSWTRSFWRLPRVASAPLYGAVRVKVGRYIPWIFYIWFLVCFELRDHLWYLSQESAFFPGMWNAFRIRICVALGLAASLDNKISLIFDLYLSYSHSVFYSKARPNSTMQYRDLLSKLNCFEACCCTMLMLIRQNDTKESSDWNAIPTQSLVGLYIGSHLSLQHFYWIK